MRLWHKFIHPITNHFRQKRGRYIREKYPDIAKWRICDIGGSKHFWEKIAIDDLSSVNVTIFNISEDETQTINSAGDKYDDINIIIFDGKNIPAKDAEFDLLVCNSVLEHVPTEQRVAFASELKRVAKHVFVQTPAYEFPIEPHFIMPFVHWLPKRIGFWLVHFSPWRLISRPTAKTIDSYFWGTRLLSRRELHALFPDEIIEQEKVLSMVKSYYVVSPPPKTSDTFTAIGRHDMSPPAT